MTARRGVNIRDYPEHLNPFHEDDNHSKLRFWTINKKKTRSNSSSFNSIKDFKESLCRSFSIRRNKMSSNSLQCSAQSINNDSEQLKLSYPVSQTHQVQYDRVRKSSIIPLTRARFHIRVKNMESEKSPTSPDNNNPFNNDKEDKLPTILEKQVETPLRKKKRAPPPPIRQSSLNLRHSVTEPSISTIKLDERIVVSDESVEKIEATEQIEAIISQEIITDSQVKDTIPSQSNNEISESLETQETNTDGQKNKSTILYLECEGLKTAEVKTVIVKSCMEHTDNKPNGTQNSQSIEEHLVHEIHVSLNCANQSETAEPQENVNDSQGELADIYKQQDISLNYNSELKMFCSETSISSETNLQHQPQKAKDDSSDLLAFVQKLQLDIDILTDDTNNNIIMTDSMNERETNINNFGVSNLSSGPESHSKIKNNE